MLRGDKGEPSDRSLRFSLVIAPSSRSVKYIALVDEYRIALGHWSEARAIYSSETLAVIEADIDLEDLESDIRWLYGNSALPRTQPSVPAAEYYNVSSPLQVS